jgi:hypothetical protein
MSESFVDQVLGKVDQAAELYHRLIFFAAPSGSGKTSALQDLPARLDLPLINLNFALSRQMLDLTERQRALQLPRRIPETYFSVFQGHNTYILSNQLHKKGLSISV